MSDTTRYFYTKEEIDRASKVSVYDYLTSGKGAYRAYDTGKYDKKTGEPIYTCDYDGASHDTVSITTNGFKHWASGKKGCYYAYEFLRDYCGYQDITKADRMKIYEEIHLAVYGVPSQSWEEHLQESKIQENSRKERKLSNTKFFSAADLSLLTKEQIRQIKPGGISEPLWNSVGSVAELYQLLLDNADDATREYISEAFGKGLPEKAVVVATSKDFIAPEKNNTNKHVYSYLTLTRGLSDKFVRWLIKEGYVYETEIKSYIDKDGNTVELKNPRYNMVVPGKDPEGQIRYAYKRELWETWDKYHCNSDTTRKPFKGEAENSSKEFSWRHENPNSSRLFLFETPMDAFSYMDIVKEKYPEDELANYLSLGGVSTVALDNFLNSRPDINKVFICLDNDYDVVKKVGEDKAAGPVNAKKIKEYLEDKGIEAVVYLSPAIPAVDIDGREKIKNGEQILTKDYNEYLRSYRAAEGNLPTKKNDKSIRRESR
ncbi:MAG: DUF3991 and toprim domain-containing protein [Saccharofermentans sp.]|nr:DUF3991 and toprim domain-containing protein [Saccharofermentans sp.]